MLSLAIKVAMIPSKKYPAVQIEPAAATLTCINESTQCRMNLRPGSQKS